MLEELLPAFPAVALSISAYFDQSCQSSIKPLFAYLVSIHCKLSTNSTKCSGKSGSMLLRNVADSAHGSQCSCPLLGNQLGYPSIGTCRPGPLASTLLMTNQQPQPRGSTADDCLLEQAVTKPPPALLLGRKQQIPSGMM